MRCIQNVKLTDHISIESLLNSCNMLSINQMMIKVKLLETWKTMNLDEYAIKLKKREISTESVTTRGTSNSFFLNSGCSTIGKNSFINDAAKLWNSVPISIKNCNTIYSAIKAIRTFLEVLPI